MDADKQMEVVDEPKSFLCERLWGLPQPSGADRHVYERQRPEETPLYRIVETRHPRFLARLEAEGAALPSFVKQEFDDYVKCGLPEQGFLRVKCDACSHEHLVAFSCERRGVCPSCGDLL